jgi:hypothetical protein
VRREAPTLPGPPGPRPLAPGLLAGRPHHGRTSNLEPLWSQLRADRCRGLGASNPPRLETAALHQLAAELGAAPEEGEAPGAAVRRAVAGWQGREGRGATLAAILPLLRGAGLQAIAGEIHQNEENSRSLESSNSLVVVEVVVPGSLKFGN